MVSSFPDVVPEFAKLISIKVCAVVTDVIVSVSPLDILVDSMCCTLAVSKEVTNHVIVMVVLATSPQVNVSWVVEEKETVTRPSLGDADSAFQPIVTIDLARVTAVIDAVPVWSPKAIVAVPL